MGESVSHHRHDYARQNASETHSRPHGNHAKGWRARSERWPERGVRFVATRFSAKEAFSKAIGKGMRMPMTWLRCEVGRLPSGEPTIVLHGELKNWFEERRLQARVSLSDESDYAVSFVVVEQLPPNP